MSILPSSILLPTFLQPEKVWLLLISNAKSLHSGTLPFALLIFLFEPSS